MQMLCKAFNSNPLHPGVLNMLAHFSLLQGDLQRVRPCYCPDLPHSHYFAAISMLLQDLETVKIDICKEGKFLLLHPSNMILQLNLFVAVNTLPKSLVYFVRCLPFGT